MVALSMLINRLLCYLNAYDDVRKECELEVVGEVIGDSRFRIATPYESHNSTYPLTFLLYKEHFVSLVAIKGDENVFDYSSTQFFNNFNNLKINLMLNDWDFI